MMRQISLGALICLLTAWSAFGQETRGTIVGRVTDPTGAVIPGAQVVVTHQAMGTKVAASANAEGLYQASFLIPGIYVVTVESAGFKKFVRKDIELRINE